MIDRAKKSFAILLVMLLVGPSLLLLANNEVGTRFAIEAMKPQWLNMLSNSGNNATPLRRLAVVASDPTSYIDDFAYIAAIPSSVFMHGGDQYLSPLISCTGSQSEKWLIEDWVEYLEPDGGITQAVGVGNLPSDVVKDIQNQIGTPLFPQITGSNPAEIAAKLSVLDWSSSNLAICALANDTFDTPVVINGEASFTFQDTTVTSVSPGATVIHGAPTEVEFTPPSSAVWLEGAFNWSSTDLLIHTLEDPLGNLVDYSVRSQVIYERNPSIVSNLVPLYFWYPKTTDGTWKVTFEQITTGSTQLVSQIKYHPGFTQTITVPSRANWLNVTATWDNAGTDLNLALVDPNGRLVQWAPAASLLAGPGRDWIDIPYPMEGDWTLLIAWMDAIEEQNNVEASWSISTLPSVLQPYLESAANGAVLASLLNAPLLYVAEDSVPEATRQAIERLGVDTVILVDPVNVHDSSLETEISSFAFLSALSSYPMMSAMIRSLSEQNDVVLTVPLGSGDEFMAPAALSAAVHGAPVFFLSGTDNFMTTRAEETWAPYKIGPQIEIFIQKRWTDRTENGWYDERIPNKYSMQKSVSEFEDFLSDRGAYNSTNPQSIVIVSPDDLLKTSFDRSLQSHFHAGRIPAKSPAMASVMINKAAHHRFLFRAANKADEVLLSLYAYNDGSPYSDNFYNGYEIHQIENTTEPLEDAGFTIQKHVGVNEVFNAIGSQVAFWSFSTHGTLTLGPRDPPQRPGGPGLFSLRNTDAPHGFEVSVEIRENPDDGDRLVNPVVYESEHVNHLIKSTDDLEPAINNIGSPIVIITACLLGGSRLPLMLMEHGAVGVIASPRTVYFQPAGLLSVLITQKLCIGSNTGDSLSEALRLISHDYYDPLPDRDPTDYANQQVLFGDPEVHLYNPDSAPRVPAIDPLAISFDNHVPGRGIPNIVGLGNSNYLPQTLSGFGVDYEYYESSNFTEFGRYLSLRRVVIVAPGSLPSLAAQLATSSNELNDFVNRGGNLIMLGVSGDLSWLPWPISYEGTTSGSSIYISDTEHPLLNTPNQLGAAVDFQGHFEDIWGNLSILAIEGANGTNPVFVAGGVGQGKLALTTTHPLGAERNMTLENVLNWYRQPSLVLNEVNLSQVIIWEGDRVVIRLEITDQVGNGLIGVALQAWLNTTEVSIEETGLGVYMITLDEAWTSGKAGFYFIRLHGSKNGYDTLSLILISFMYIRPSPWPAIFIGAGIVGVVVIGYLYARYRAGKALIPRRKKKEQTRYGDKSKKEKERQKKEDEKVDLDEYFGV